MSGADKCYRAPLCGAYKLLIIMSMAGKFNNSKFVILQFTVTFSNNIRGKVLEFMKLVNLLHGKQFAITHLVTSKNGFIIYYSKWKTSTVAIL